MAGVSAGGLELGGEEVPPASPAHPDLERRQRGGEQGPTPVGAAELTAELRQVDAAEDEDQQCDADGDAEGDLEQGQRPSWASTASTWAGTAVGRDADSSAVSGSFSPWPVRVRTIVDPGSKRPALTDLIKPATLAA